MLLRPRSRTREPAPPTPLVRVTERPGTRAASSSERLAGGAATPVESMRPDDAPRHRAGSMRPYPTGTESPVVCAPSAAPSGDRTAARIRPRTTAMTRLTDILTTMRSAAETPYARAAG